MTAPGRISKLRSNPATRAALDAKFLTPQQRKQRDLNQRLDAPVTPGSSMTGRQLAHSRDAALQVQFGPAENAINQQLAGQGQLGSDLDKAYALYLKDLQDHAANIRNLNTASNTADQQLTASVGGLKSDVSGAQQDVQDKAGQATAIRQALLASFGAEHNAVGTSNAGYADTLANVVGPGQKLQSTAQQGRNTQAIRQKLIDLAGQKGAAGKAYMADTVAGEAKNALANQALGLNVAKADATAASGRASRREAIRHHKAQEQATTNSAKAQGQKINQYGYTNDAWQALSTQERQKIIAAAKAKPKGAKPVDPVKQQADDFYKKYGIKPASQQAVSGAQKQISAAQTWIKTVKASNQGISDADLGRLLVTGQAADKKSGSPAIPAQDALMVRVALDLTRPPYRISNATANRLHHAGFSVRALGLKSIGELDPAGQALSTVSQTIGTL